MRHFCLWALAVLVSLMAGAVHAQPSLLHNAAHYTPIEVEPKAQTSVGALTGLSNRIFKPEGLGPFPAVVLVHTCGGLKNAHMRLHAQELLRSGYAVFMQDSHGPRGFETCRQKNLPFAVGVMDAYQGLKALAAQDFIDAERIYLAGYSYGGAVAAMVADRQSALVFGAQRRFRASVGNYTECQRKSGAQIVTKDVDRPLLLLLGGKDAESPLASCFPLLEDYKRSGLPVEWHVYPDATHGWDKMGEGHHDYTYDEAVTRDANQRMLAFFERHR
jgi:dienelactone hydrolase